MDKEQAIEKLNDIRCHVKETSAEEQALVMAIDALKQPVATDANVGDTISRQAALNALARTAREKFNLSDEYNHYLAGLMDGELAIKELPTIQPEPSHTQKSCEYCHEDSDGYTRPIEKNCHAYIRFGMNGWELDLKAKGWHGEAQIKFCPMCGRRLING